MMSCRFSQEHQPKPEEQIQEYQKQIGAWVVLELDILGILLHILNCIFDATPCNTEYQCHLLGQVFCWTQDWSAFPKPSTVLDMSGDAKKRTRCNATTRYGVNLQTRMTQHRLHCNTASLAFECPSICNSLTPHARLCKHYRLSFTQDLKPARSKAVCWPFLDGSRDVLHRIETSTAAAI